MRHRHSAASLFVILLLYIPNAARADGGRLRFSRTAGPFLVTLFTTPEPLTPGPADFSVMIQDAATGQILPDAKVSMQWSHPGGKTVNATPNRAAATNKLLMAADIVLPEAANWRLRMDVADGSRHTVCEADILVEPGSRKAMLVWIFALLPALAVVLFALHQRQKQRLRPAGMPGPEEHG